ncbi:MAG TPA: hypothetical protein VKB41_06365 [Steroidobacteraceae bacterium]|nr:hypothetical protein [Steroidobacteraceae bacterium]
MTHSTLISLGRRTLQIATLSLIAAAPLAFGGEPVTSDRTDQLIGQMVVSATHERVLIGDLVVSAPREQALIGHLVVSAARLSPASVTFANLGAMSVTALRDTSLASNEASQATQASL